MGVIRRDSVALAFVCGYLCDGKSWIFGRYGDLSLAAFFGGLDVGDTEVNSLTLLRDCNSAPIRFSLLELGLVERMELPLAMASAPEVLFPFRAGYTVLANEAVVCAFL